jgi:hypothetical protein
MAYTETDVQRLEQAIASGTMRVKYADREVTYHSLKEMRSALREIRNEVSAAAGAPRRKRVVRLFQSGRG